MTETIQELVRTAFHNGRNMLSEADSTIVLADAGIPMVSTIRCNTPDEAGAAAESLSFPVALKGCGEQLWPTNLKSVLFSWGLPRVSR